MSRHVGDRHSLASGKSSKPCSAGHVSGSCVFSESSIVGLLHLDLTPRPSTSQFDGPPRTVVVDVRFLEEV